MFERRGFVLFNRSKGSSKEVFRVSVRTRDLNPSSVEESVLSFLEASVRSSNGYFSPFFFTSPLKCRRFKATSISEFIVSSEEVFVIVDDFGHGFRSITVLFVSRRVSSTVIGVSDGCWSSGAPTTFSSF